MKIHIALSPKEEAKIDTFFRKAYGYSLHDRIVRDIGKLLDNAREQMAEIEKSKNIDK